MKKTYLSLPLLILSLTTAAHAAPALDFSDEVADVDSIGGRITFKAKGEYFVDPASLLKDINRKDLVNVTLSDDKGGQRVVKLVKTGIAPEEDKGLPVGEAVRDVLKATGETARFVTSPIEPVHEATSATVGATTDNLGEAVKDAKGPQTKTDF